MPTLRLTQSVAGEHRFHVEAALEGDGPVRQTVTIEFDFQFTEQDRENIRWYLRIPSIYRRPCAYLCCSN